MKYLVAKSGLPTSVINILINYVYNIQQQPTLKAEYVNRIANEWGQSGIHSPEKAIEHVRELAKQSQTKQKQRQQNYSGNAKLFDKSDCQNGQISQTMKQNFPQKNKPS